MNFDRLYQLLFETSFDKLPDNPPYGYWIYPNGDFKTVPCMEHSEVAMEIIEKDPHLNERYMKKRGSPSALLESLNYITAVHMDWKNMLIWRNMIGYTQINNQQLRTLRDLAKYYKMDLGQEKF